MQEKYQAYETHDWIGNENQQKYMNVLYPTPTTIKMEKFRAIS